MLNTNKTFFRVMLVIIFFSSSTLVHAEVSEPIKNRGSISILLPEFQLAASDDGSGWYEINILPFLFEYQINSRSAIWIETDLTIFNSSDVSAQIYKSGITFYYPVFITDRDPSLPMKGLHFAPFMGLSRVHEVTRNNPLDGTRYYGMSSRYGLSGGYGWMRKNGFFAMVNLEYSHYMYDNQNPATQNLTYSDNNDTDIEFKIGYMFGR